MSVFRSDIRNLSRSVLFFLGYFCVPLHLGLPILFYWFVVESLQYRYLFLGASIPHHILGVRSQEKGESAVSSSQGPSTIFHPKNA